MWYVFLTISAIYYCHFAVRSLPGDSETQAFPEASMDQTATVVVNDDNNRERIPFNEADSDIRETDVAIAKDVIKEEPNNE